MDTSFRHALTELKRDAFLRIVNGSGRSVVVFRGLLWVTQEGDRRDIFLRGGQSFTIDQPGTTIVEALEDSSLLVLDPEPPAEDDGPPVAIRPLRPDDAARLDRLIRDVSAEARRRRFHVAVNELTPAWLQRLTQVRMPAEAALLATVADVGGELAIGEARYGEVEHAAHTREFALLVDDRWQGKGIGRRLLSVLLQLAQRTRVRWLYGDVLADNAPMLALARRLGFVQQAHPLDERLTRVVRFVDGFGRPLALQ